VDKPFSKAIPQVLNKARKTIPIFQPVFGAEEREYLLDCIDSGWVSSQGRYVGEFERMFAERVGVPGAVSCSNCTTALHLALVGLGIGPGDEVICPDLTFISPANMVRLTGATAVLADINPRDWGLNPADVEAKITPRTRALLVVHLFGHAADMDPIMAIAARHGLAVIEDVAEAPDARYKGKPVGTFGDAACYSFYGNKILTTGEGGMILCRDPELERRLRILRDHGMSPERRYVHDVSGFNYRLTNMQAALGLGQLQRVGQIQAARKQQEGIYRELFAGSPRAAWRPIEPWCETVHWLATISLRRRDLRDGLLDHLKDEGIEGRPMIFPVHQAKPFADCGSDADFPVSTDISLRSLHLPSGLNLERDDLEYIVETVLEWVAKNDR
jgi:perosamine synthetase